MAATTERLFHVSQVGINKAGAIMRGDPVDIVQMLNAVCEESNDFETVVLSVAAARIAKNANGIKPFFDIVKTWKDEIAKK